MCESHGSSQISAVVALILHLNYIQDCTRWVRMMSGLEEPLVTTTHSPEMVMEPKTQPEGRRQTADGHHKTIGKLFSPHVTVRCTACSSPRTSHRKAMAWRQGRRRGD